MTFCVGLRVREGLIALGDTRIVKGDEHVIKSKLSYSAKGSRHWWLMTSGLRSIRDKAVVYFEQETNEESPPKNNLFELANCFGQQIRRVRSEDGSSLASSNYSFNLHAILGGKLDGDSSSKMFYIYPEGNWIESNEESPYFIIGRTHYAKPILDKLLCFETPARSALALAYLAFDATRSSVTDVDFPVDIVLFSSLLGQTSFYRFHEDELNPLTQWWNKELVSALERFPAQAFDPLFKKANPA